MIPQSEEQEEELLVRSRSPAKSKKLFTVLAVLCVVGAVVGIIVAVTQTSGSKGAVFSYEDIFTTTTKTSSVHWLSDGHSYAFRESNGDIMRQELDDFQDQQLSTPTLLLDHTLLEPDTEVHSYAMNDGMDRMLLATEYQKVWRHSFRARYLVYTLGDDNTSLLHPDAGAPLQMAALWSPSGDVCAYVMENNIYVRDVQAGAQPVQVTSDGAANNVDTIINGVHNWVYEEELYGANPAMWWNTAATRLAFLKSDQSQVSIFSWPMYYQDDDYTPTVDVPYPKAGTTNPSVQVWVYNTATQDLDEIDLSAHTAIDPNGELYITNIVWLADDELVIRTHNRLQNASQLLRVTLSAATPVIETLFTNTVQDGWLNNNYVLRSVPDTTLLLDLQDNYDADQPHLCLLDVANPDQRTWLTSASEWSVSSVQGMRLEEGVYQVYFLAKTDNGRESTLMKVNVGSGEVQGVTDEDSSYSMSFSPSADYYIEYYLGSSVDLLSVPTSTLAKNGDWRYVLEDNKAARDRLEELELPRREFFSIPASSTGGEYDLNAMIYLPPGYSSSKKYPLLFYNYGGPGSQRVMKGHALGFDAYLASQGIMVAAMDGRGTGGRGLRFMHEVYLQLGVKETEDIIDAGRYVADEYKASSNGHWGWSFGGYMTSRVMEADTEGVFSMGIAVAPVTSWRYYDSTYTERYMGVPQPVGNIPDNSAGYNVTSVLEHVDNFKNKEYLLIHGLADDNVHFQNAALLVKKLIEEEVQFESFYYPNEDHGIPSRRHLYKFMSRYISEHLSVQLDTDVDVDVEE